MISLKLYPDYENKIIVVDGSSVCWYEPDTRNRPKLSNLTMYFCNLEDLGVKKHHIKIFCDANLKYHINNQKEYFSLKRKKTIQECPAGIKADKFILNFCLKHPNSLIISNDLFREYYDQLPDAYWINKRRIAFMKINKEFIFVPMCSIKLICRGDQ